MKQCASNQGSSGPRGAAALAAAAALSAALLFSGCATQAPLVRGPGQVAATHHLTVSGDEQARYARLLKDKPGSPLAPQACYFLGQAAFNAKDWQGAERYFRLCRQDYPGTGWDQDSQYMLGLTLEQEGETDQALAQYQQVASQSGGLPLLAGQAQADCARLLGQVQDPAQLAQMRALLTSPDLQALADERAMQLMLNAGQLPALQQASQNFLRNYPQSPLLPQVQQLVSESYRLVTINARTLGVMVPANSGYGQQVLSGAQLALDQANAGLPPGQQFHLVQADEGSNSVQAQAAANKLINQDRVLAIVGPLFSSAARAVAPLSALDRVPIISPTAAEPGLTSLSPFFLRNCITNGKQADEMADHALLDLKLTRVACLYPDDNYGRSLAQDFARRLTSLGGTMVAMVSYTAGTTDFRDSMLALGGIDPGEEKQSITDLKKKLQLQVEASCNRVGADLLHLLDLSRTAMAQQEQEALAAHATSTPTPQPDATPTPLGTLAVVDFAPDSATASRVRDIGRDLSNLYWRTLDLLDDKGLNVLPPSMAASYLASHGLTPAQLNPSSAADLARGLGAQWFLGGTVTRKDFDMAALQAQAARGGWAGKKARELLDLAKTNEFFTATAQLVDAASNSILATSQFDFYKLKPVTPNAMAIQALYLPCESGDVLMIAPNLAYYDLSPQLLGSNAWHHQDLLRGADNLEGAQFTTGFFLGSTDPGVPAFVKAYQQQFAEDPGTLAAEAFDACSMVLKAAEGGADTREDLRDALLNIRGFPGVSGTTSFGGQQDAVKQLPILEVKGGQLVQVK